MVHSRAWGRGGGQERETDKQKKPRLKSKPIPQETMTVSDLDINHTILVFNALKGIGHVALGPHKMGKWN